jgi:hypothetical protein
MTSGNDFARRPALLWGKLSPATTASRSLRSPRTKACSAGRSLDSTALIQPFRSALRRVVSRSAKARTCSARTVLPELGFGL